MSSWSSLLDPDGLLFPTSPLSPPSPDIALLTPPRMTPFSQFPKLFHSSSIDQHASYFEFFFFFLSCKGLWNPSQVLFSLVIPSDSSTWWALLPSVHLLELDCFYYIPPACALVVPGSSLFISTSSLMSRDWLVTKTIHHVTIVSPCSFPITSLPICISEFQVFYFLCLFSFYLNDRPFLYPDFAEDRPLTLRLLHCYKMTNNTHCSIFTRSIYGSYFWVNSLTLVNTMMLKVTMTSVWLFLIDDTLSHSA